MADQASRLRQLVGSRVEEPAAPSMRADGTKVIAVTSGKGGVGKTNLTVNLALALGMLGQRVLIVDADLGMANVDVVLGSRAKHALMDLLDPAISLEDVIVQGPYGVSYIPGGSGIEKAATFSAAEQRLLLQKLASCGQMADIILIDTGAGLGKNVMDFILAADEVLLVTTPEPTSLTDAYAVMKAYSVYAPDGCMKLVINRVYEEEESREVANKLAQTAERFLHIRIDSLGYIFDDPMVRKAVRRQTPFVAAWPDSAASRCVRALANGLLYGSQMQVKRGWKGFLQQIFNFSR